MILDDLLQDTRHEFLETLGRPFFKVAENARYCDILAVKQYLEMVYCDRPSL
jgi:hypothetical protein